jgi:hypothetical protein
MMNKVKNSESPIKTIFGGIVVKPSACRNKENTMMILVKLVISTRAAGKKLSAVIANTVSTGTEYSVPLPACLAVTRGRV